MELGVSREDAFNFVAVGCNELAIPGQMYFNPGANVSYLSRDRSRADKREGIQTAMEVGERCSAGRATRVVRPIRVCGRRLYATRNRELLQVSDESLEAQMQVGPDSADLLFLRRMHRAGTRLDCRARSTTYCPAAAPPSPTRSIAWPPFGRWFTGNSRRHLRTSSRLVRRISRATSMLRAKLLAAPKHGNDDPAIGDLVRLVERLRDEPMKEICRDPRDGTPFGNCHVVRSSAVTQGLVTVPPRTVAWQARRWPVPWRRPWVANAAARRRY